MDEVGRNAAIAAIVAKRDALIGERGDLRRRRAELAVRDREIDRELADCRAAARLFGAKIEFPADEDEPVVRAFREPLFRFFEPKLPSRSSAPQADAAEAARPEATAAALDAAIQQALG